jgi:hypothetical protein
MSPYQFTLADAKADRAIRIATGQCVDGPDFAALVNQAQRMLMKRGNWFGTEWLVKFCISDGCIVWPRFVGTVMGIRFCGSLQSAFMQNQWYTILGQYCNGYSNWAGYGNGMVVEDTGTAPCFNEVMCPEGKLIRYVVTKRPDLGKTVKIFGTAFGGQPLQERDANGNWTNGITITAADPFGSTTVLVTHITSVLREATQGPAWLYEYNATDDIQRMLASYQSSETKPRYRKSKIRNWNQWWGQSTCPADSNNQRIRSIEALVKLEFIPATLDDDFLFIDDFDALSLMIKAIRCGEADDNAGFAEKTLFAVKEMNLRERDKLPNNQTVVSVQAFGSIPITNPT